MGVKLDDQVRARLRQIAERDGRTTHFLVRQIIIAGLERLERGEMLDAAPASPDDEPAPGVPFLDFAQDVQPQTVLRSAITASYRRPEPEIITGLIEAASLPAAQVQQARDTTTRLINALRARRHSGLVETLLQEYALSSQEGVALMCLAEALLRIPDPATRDALIRDKIGAGDWQSHVGVNKSVFVNAATWGLMLTGKLSATASETGLASALTKLIARGGEPVVRRSVHIAMRLMGEQFVMGQTIADALANARKREARGFSYSYDMLGEAALTASDAARYYRDYEQAIHAIGSAAKGKGIYRGPGISVKLSALHPRYSRAQRGRVMAELAPRLTALALLAKRYDIGINIDAEEADRLDLSLDLLEGMCFEPGLAGWNGIGFVVQAYQKRARPVIEFLIDLARRSHHRLMVRLVKGAYWDTEIKRAQIDGLEDFPVFTRKIHTDISYLACARTMLGARAEIFPQFATHNALTLASIHAIAGPKFEHGDYEFQCLHGMGEPLYDEVIGTQKLDRPCRIYAPVGTHETLLAYLVRRLLENGANTSFVNKLADPKVTIDQLLADPVDEARRVTPLGSQHPKIAAPHAILGDVRRNSAGFDLSSEQRLGSLAPALLGSVETVWQAGSGPDDAGRRTLLNPANTGDRVGTVIEPTPDTIEAAMADAVATAPIWQSTQAFDRAAILDRAADLLEHRMPNLLGLIVREAGKSLTAAISEVREAVDFLRYDAEQLRDGFDNATHRPLGIVAAISPWNFPLAIFTGQVAAALAAGNVVLAKPAEETPLIAAAAVHLLHEAGVPDGALQLLPGDGAVGAALVADARVRGVIFTGSTAVAKLIQATLAERLDPSGMPVPLIAETGGQNAMIVDSSALLEQAVGDIVGSAFDSAGQRCSALRILLVQDDIADSLLTMLRGAMAELSIGNPDRLASDVGPVISAEARDLIRTHVAGMEERGFRVFAATLPPETESGFFVAPTLIEIDHPSSLEREVFGPVLHVVRFRRQDRNRMIDAVNALGYALTFGVHSRIDETITHAAERIEAGNIYINRNIVGAVVGVQPFGGHGMSGTGPKAGGPLYLRRLLAQRPPMVTAAKPVPALEQLVRWLETAKIDPSHAKRYAGAGPMAAPRDLQGPVGEQNTYILKPRGRVLCRATTADAAWRQVAACVATGNHPLVLCNEAIDGVAAMPAPIRPEIVSDGVAADGDFDAVLFQGDRDTLLALQQILAVRPGPIVAVHAMPEHAIGEWDYPLEFLLTEQSISVNTAAAGGNASLMTIG